MLGLQLSPGYSQSVRCSIKTLPGSGRPAGRSHAIRSFEGECERRLVSRSPLENERIDSTGASTSAAASLSRRTASGVLAAAWASLLVSPAAFAAKMVRQTGQSSEAKVRVTMPVSSLTSQSNPEISLLRRWSCGMAAGWRCLSTACH